MAAVDEHRELDRLRTPEVDERVHRRAHRAAGEEHVVDEEDLPAVDGERDVRSLDDRILHAPIEIVAVERDVDDAERHRRPAFDLLYLLPDALGEEDAAGADPDQRELVGSLVALEDLVRDAREGALDRERIHHLPGAVGAHPTISRLDALARGTDVMQNPS